ncbi:MULTISPECIES: hypothetical protein [unclassified Bacillus (in: firmicutes)]|uniref:hypothetical protein n=1 Tax=unclassified Bacillus (in: firmicutes) TaxID=185979 RepID=UPI0008F20323|nr:MULTISPECIES: hypothetical protein [unclassified Bacillus (in: firmicutes)]SFA70594.1 hypothetical protein SAMN02799634_101130 [Bacillus sp. UNCCL13]SFQ60472.1 hypothetical protein SAMN04488577_0414 [Bacillus sp. cl95]
MITFLIILAEVCFWIFIILGLVTRYVFKKEKLSILLFGATPLIDLILLIFTAFDLKSGAEATFVHALAAIYIGVSLAFGKQMIKWADIKFQYHFLKIDNRPAKLFGIERGKKEMEGFFRHLIAYLIGATLLVGMKYLLKETTDTEYLISTLRTWSVILGLDFFISLSYRLFPTTKKEKLKEE